MTTDETTILLAAAAVLWVLLFVANAIQDGRIIRRLRDHDSATWQQLGRPAPFRLWNRSVGAFLKGNGHHQLGDATLSRMVAIQRVLGGAHLVAFLAFLAMMFLAAR